MIFFSISDNLVFYLKLYYAIVIILFSCQNLPVAFKGVFFLYITYSFLKKLKNAKSLYCATTFCQH